MSETGDFHCLHPGCGARRTSESSIKSHVQNYHRVDWSTILEGFHFRHGDELYSPDEIDHVAGKFWRELGSCLGADDIVFECERRPPPEGDHVGS